MLDPLHQLDKLSDPLPIILEPPGLFSASLGYIYLCLADIHAHIFFCHWFLQYNIGARTSKNTVFLDLTTVRAFSMMDTAT